MVLREFLQKIASSRTEETKFLGTLRHGGQCVGVVFRLVRRVSKIRDDGSNRAIFGNVSGASRRWLGPRHDGLSADTSRRTRPVERFEPCRLPSGDEFRLNRHLYDGLPSPSRTICDGKRSPSNSRGGPPIIAAMDY